jgi:hypothetical protein
MDSANYSLWEDVQELPDSGRQDDRRESENQAPKYEVNDSELFRHKCEVRWLLRERIRRGQAGILWLKGYLQTPPVQARRQMLEKDIREQWKFGNKGQEGDWYLA